jgi:hypothetical protein
MAARLALLRFGEVYVVGIYYFNIVPRVGGRLGLDIDYQKVRGKHLNDGVSLAPSFLPNNIEVLK